jgi:hypothetical protein
METKDIYRIRLTFVIQLLINVFPRIVFVRTFFLHISRESNNIYCFCLIIFGLFIDSLPYLKKNKRTIKSYGSAARLDQAIVIEAPIIKNVETPDIYVLKLSQSVRIRF